MKSIAIAELEKLAALEAWQHHQHIDIAERSVIRSQTRSPDGEQYYPVALLHLAGTASIVSTLEAVAIVYSECFAYDDCRPGSLVTSGGEWNIGGIAVLDEDGRMLRPGDVADYLDSAFSAIDYSELGV